MMFNLIIILTPILIILGMGFPLLALTYLIRKLKPDKYENQWCFFLYLGFASVLVFALITFYDLSVYGDTILQHRIIGHIFLFFAYSTTSVVLVLFYSDLKEWLRNGYRKNYFGAKRVKK